MKSFVEYLTESKKTYDFKIKVAGELPEDFENKLKGAMEKFSVVSMSKGKRTPIQETPLDFPQLKNTHVTTFELSVHYPTTSQVLETYINQVCGCVPGSVAVRTGNEAAVSYQEELNRKEAEKPLIGQCDPAPSNNQELVGDKKVSDFLKSLTKTNIDQYKGVNDSILASSVPTEKSEPKLEPAAGVSPIGSKALKGK